MSNRAKAEVREIGLAGLRQISEAAAAVSDQAVEGASGRLIGVGAISAFESAAAELSRTKEREADERQKAANVAFQTVWKAAEPLFSDGSETPAACPVCLTPITETNAGSAEGVRHSSLGIDHLHNSYCAEVAF